MRSIIHSQMVALGNELDGLNALCHQRGNIAWMEVDCEVASADARHIKEVANQLHHSLATRKGLSKEGALRGINLTSVTLQHHRYIALHTSERCTQLVARHADKLILRCIELTQATVRGAQLARCVVYRLGELLLELLRGIVALLRHQRHCALLSYHRKGSSLRSSIRGSLSRRAQHDISTVVSLPHQPQHYSNVVTTE